MNVQPRFRSRSRLAACLFALLAQAFPAAAQQPAFNSHEVNADRSLTLRYYAPSARKVAVTLDYDQAHPMPLTKGADGTWTLTTAALEPALHSYALEVDGTPILDPLNPLVDPGYVYLTNEVEVPGPGQPWDAGDSRHGVVHHHAYRSRAILGLPGDLEDYYVYTPAGYDPSAGKLYPVLYLLHGWSAASGNWMREGKANLILDTLIAHGQAVPMVAVMPLGYGNLTFVTGGFDQWKDPAKIGDNIQRFSGALLSEIMPQVEANYRVSPRRDDRAIAGLSMGGGESLVIGLNHPDAFGWVGGFSSAVAYDQYDGVFPNLGTGPGPKLLWVACGTGDGLVGANRRFVAWLRTKALHPIAVETPGIHNWPVWRDNLIHFAPLLFR
jgi:enterochelin esterase-like enzyme